MLYLMTGSPYCKYWDQKFIQYSRPFKPTVLSYRDFHTFEFQKNSIFLGRINQFSNINYEQFKTKHVFSNSFPSLNIFNFYDNKFKQAEFFKSNNIKTPYTEILLTPNDKTLLSFPLVCKLSQGASSKNVFLAQSVKDLVYPCLVQEYIPSNKDCRITVVGDYLFGFNRLNRPNDFRASGSGLIEKISSLPNWEMLYNLCLEHKFETMCFDLINDYVIEMSYTYRADVLSYFDFYLDAKTGKQIAVDFDIPSIVFNNFIKLKL